MKLKDLIGIIPRSEKICLNNNPICRFDEVPWSALNKEIQMIWADLNSNGRGGVIGIEIRN